MPVEITPNSTKFFTQYRNGDDFTDNSGDFTPNLAAEVGEKIQLVQEIDIQWFFQATSSDKVEFENLGSDLFRYKKVNGGWFGDDGFVATDTIDVISSGSPTISGTITNLSQTWMTIQFSTTVTTPDGVTSISLFRGTSDLTALIYKFGLIENQEVFNTASKVTQHDQSYYASGMTEGGGAITFIPQGTYKDWQTGTGSVKRLTDPSTYTQRFEIIHEFIVSPYYVDGQLTNLQNVVLPSLFTNNQSLKYAFRVDFRLALSYVGSAKVTIIDDVPGSVGWFEQNFNGFENLYSITDVNYKDDAAASADGILSNGNSVITVTVAKSSGAFVSTDKIGAIVSFLAESVDYQDKPTTLTENFMYDNNFCLADGTPVAGSGIITETSAVLSGDDIVLTIKTTYSTAQKTVLANKIAPNFLLAISIGDVTILNGNSDRVILIADALPYDRNPDIPGLATLVSWLYFAQDDDIGVEPGSTDLIAWPEDGFASTFEFTIDLNKNVFINSIEIKLVAFNGVTGTFFDLDSFFIPISGAIISGGVQQIEFTGSRGYTLASGSQFNDVTITTGANVGGIQTYTGTFSQKISWQDWIENLAVNTLFYDNTKPNNNLNFKASNYSNISNYTINAAIVMNLTGTSDLGITGDTVYALAGNAITVHDYDKDEFVVPIWSGTIKTFTEDGLTDLGGAILTNGDNTLVEVTWVNSVAPVVAIPNFWGIFRIEVSLQQGYNIFELSSIRNQPTNQLPIPEAGESFLNLTVDSGNILGTGLIDGSLVQGATSYNLSERLQSPNKKAEVDLINFRTESETPDTFTGTIVKSGDVASWNYGDGTALDVTNTPSHVYTVPKEKIGYIQIDSFASVTGLTMNSDKLNGILDLSDLISITTIEIEDHIPLDGIINPSHANVMVKYSVEGCVLLTSVDVSGLTKLGGIFNASLCTGLVTIVLPISTQTFSLFDVNLSNVNYFDLTTLSNLTESIGVTIDLSDNSLNATEVNHFLVDLDAMSTGGFAGRTILIDGNNAAPDGSSGGFDGVTAKANLITKTFIVTSS